MFKSFAKLHEFLGLNSLEFANIMIKANVPVLENIQVKPYTEMIKMSKKTLFIISILFYVNALVLYNLGKLSLLAWVDG